MPPLFDFIEFDRFYDRYAPVSPYGKQHKQRRVFHRDKASLEEEYDRIERCRSFIDSEPAKGEQVSYFLKRVPLLSDQLDEWNFETLFNVKRFLFNFARIDKLLPRNLLGQQQQGFDSAALLVALSPDGDRESFHLSDRYSTELKAIREMLNQLDRRQEELRTAAINRTEQQLGLRFDGREFLVVSDSMVEAPCNGSYHCEPYDSASVLIRPSMPDAFFELRTERSQVLERENAVHREIFSRLGVLIARERDRLELYKETITRLDTAMAKARLAASCQMTRPKLLSPGGAISVEGGRFLPLEERCRETHSEYAPLRLASNEPVAVLTGANMGGKTVVLKTVGYLQTLAQMGFFVPAVKFQTVVFQRIDTLGETSDDHRRGLSSFAMEILRFKEAFVQEDGASLLLVDEMARTTTAREAAAIVTGVLKALRRKKHTCAFISTHLTDLPRLDGIAYLRMGGLRPAALKGLVEELSGGLDDRIKAINGRMDFVVLTDDRKHRSSDGMVIAEALGLDSHILNEARRYLGGANEN